MIHNHPFPTTCSGHGLSAAKSSFSLKSGGLGWLGGTVEKVRDPLLDVIVVKW